MSICNLEDEIVHSCTSLSNINSLFKTNGTREFKAKYISHDNIKSKLEEVGFDMKKIFSRKSNYPFDKYNNDGFKIKRIKTK